MSSPSPPVPPPPEDHVRFASSASMDDHDMHKHRRLPSPPPDTSVRSLSPSPGDPSEDELLPPETAEPIAIGSRVHILPVVACHEAAPPEEHVHFRAQSGDDLDDHNMSRHRRIESPPPERSTSPDLPAQLHHPTEEELVPEDADKPLQVGDKVKILPKVESFEEK